MGSLGNIDQQMVLPTHMSVDADDAEAADNRKHMVMGMIAVASVMATVFGTLILSDVLHALSGLVCMTIDLPSFVKLH